MPKCLELVTLAVDHHVLLIAVKETWLSRGDHNALVAVCWQNRKKYPGRK